jgi:hypothetical protein
LGYRFQIIPAGFDMHEGKSMKHINRKFFWALNLAAGLVLLASSLALAEDYSVNNIVYHPGYQNGIARNAAPRATVNPGAQIAAVSTPSDPWETPPPVITSHIDGKLGTNGWYVSDVTVTWTVTNGESSITSTSGCDSITIDTDTAGFSLTCTATSAGGSTTSSVTIQRDATAPVVTLTPDRGPDHGAWYNQPVSFAVTGSDATSGLTGCDPAINYSGPDQAASSVSGICTDNAGNVGKASAALQYNATAPVVILTPDRAPDHNGWYNKPIGFTVSGTDAFSNTASCAAPVLYAGPDHAAASVSGTCTDNAGNVGLASATFQYDATAPVVTLAPDRDPDLDGQYTNPVGFTPSGTDETSGLAGCDPAINYSGPDTAAASTSGTCTDNAGNVGTGWSDSFQYAAVK